MKIKSVKKHKDFMNANKLEKTLTDIKEETGTIDNKQEAMLKENTNKLDTLGKDIGNTQYLALLDLVIIILYSRCNKEIISG